MNVYVVTAVRFQYCPVFLQTGLLLNKNTRGSDSLHDVSVVCALFWPTVSSVRFFLRHPAQLAQKKRTLDRVGQKGAALFTNKFATCEPIFKNLFNVRVSSRVVTMSLLIIPPHCQLVLLHYLVKHLVWYWVAIVPDFWATLYNGIWTNDQRAIFVDD